MPRNRAPDWVVPAMRAGYAARGLTYLIVGGLAVAAAFGGGRAEGTTGALASLRGAPWGQALLWIVAVGLFAYAVWRLLAAAMDLEAHGSGGKGIVARLGLTVSGIVHGGLAYTAAQLAMGNGSGRGGGSAEDWTAQLMALPWGRWLVILAGVAVIGAGGYYAWKGIGEKYKENMRLTRTTERLDWVCKVGLLAHGVVVAIIGGFLVYAGWTADPSEAGGLGQAFATVRDAAFGRVLLALLGLGMVAFAVFCVLQAIYRIVPRAADPDLQTMSGKALGEVRRVGARMKARTA